MAPLLRDLSALLAPDRCVACGDRGRQPWCQGCEAQAAKLRIERNCRRCGAEVGRHGCWPVVAPVTGGLTLYRYRGVVAAAVVAGKARGAAGVWGVLGDRLGAAVRDTDLGAIDVVTWVPTDPRRIRERGVDHAVVLARRVAVATAGRAARLLSIGHRRPDQARLPDHERRQVPDAAFRALVSLRRARVLLVDDVLTTGGTAHAAAEVLVRAGADNVRLAAFARAGDHPLGRRPSPSEDPPGHTGPPPSPLTRHPGDPV